MGERAAEQLDLGAITDTTTKEIVARYALVFPDEHYVCPACGERQG
jgi:hypothetical protein